MASTGIVRGAGALAGRICSRCARNSLLEPRSAIPVASNGGLGHSRYFRTTPIRVKAAALHIEAIHDPDTHNLHQSTGLPGNSDTSAVESCLPSMAELRLQPGDRAMSGGIDSAVTLKILHDMPIDVDVIFMRNWDSVLSEDEADNDTSRGTTTADPSSSAIPSRNQGLTDLVYSTTRRPVDGALSIRSSDKGKGKSTCGWERDWEDVQRVCQHMGVPADRVRMVDFSKEYWTQVFEPSVAVWEAGGTPNPDVACNSEIKFGKLLHYSIFNTPATPKSGDSSKWKGKHYLATGHYARVDRIESPIPRYRLLRCLDQTKDQTYYLSGLTEKQVSHAVFPLAGIPKATVRRLARHWQLPNAEREESMGVCFIGERGRFGDFITQYTNPSELSNGNLIGPWGDVVGSHQGMWHYTIGQGAKLSGMNEKYFVARKGVGPEGRDILVVPGANHPALMCQSVYVPSFRWIHGSSPDPPTSGSLGVLAQLRHRMRAVPANIDLDPSGSGLRCHLDQAVAGISPGQVLALYTGDECLGSGVIESTSCADEGD